MVLSPTAPTKSVLGAKDTKLLRWGGSSGDVLFGHLAGITPSLNNLGEFWGMRAMPNCLALWGMGALSSCLPWVIRTGDSGFKYDVWIKDVVGVYAADWLLCL